MFFLCVCSGTATEVKIKSLRIRDGRNKTIFAKQRKRDPAFLHVKLNSFNSKLYGLNSQTHIHTMPFE